MLARDHAHAFLRGDADQRRGALGDLALARLRVDGGHILAALVWRAIDHAGGRRANGFEGRGAVIDDAGIGLRRADMAGHGDGLVGHRRLVESLAQQRGLLQQGHAAGVVARRIAAGRSMFDPVAGKQDAAART